MHPLDATLQSACPCVMFPRYGDFQYLPEQSDTHRFLICSDGLYVECRRPWVHLLLKVSDVGIPLPYGTPTPFLNLRLPTRPLIQSLLHFIQRAREISPLEHAAWLTYDPTTATMDYREPLVLSRSRDRIQYHRPAVTQLQLPVIDCHSHGLHPAGFSLEDDQDDVDDAKLSFVVGNLDQPIPSVALRFVGFGFAHDISTWAEALLYPEIQLDQHSKTGENDDSRPSPP